MIHNFRTVFRVDKAGMQNVRPTDHLLKKHYEKRIGEVRINYTGWDTLASQPYILFLQSYIK